MKWRMPALGDRRKVKKFLWLPLTLETQGESIKEKRWLMFVCIIQRYGRNGWENERFSY